MIKKTTLLVTTIRVIMFLTFLINFIILSMLTIAFSENIEQKVMNADLLNEVLKCLPKNSRIATFNKIVEGKIGLKIADVDNDGKKEIIVAYYTEPHEYVTNGETDEKFFKRAHVKILKNEDGKLVEVWDSGGFGFEFGCRIDFKNMDKSLRDSYLENLFDVRDLTGDGQPEIIFTRTSFLAEGVLSEVWGWDGKNYKRIFQGGNLFRTEIDYDKVYKIICEFNYKGIPEKTPLIYRWDGKCFKKFTNDKVE